MKKYAFSTLEMGNVRELVRILWGVVLRLWFSWLWNVVRFEV